MSLVRPNPFIGPECEIESPAASVSLGGLKNSRGHGGLKMAYKSNSNRRQSKADVLGDRRELRLQLQIITFLGLTILVAGIVVEQVILR